MATGYPGAPGAPVATPAAQYPEQVLQKLGPNKNRKWMGEYG